MQLEQQKGEFERRGMNVAAMSYDDVPVIRHFAERKGIKYPLLADPKSVTIKAFGILNTSVPADSFAYGVPHPGTFLIDANGIVQAKFFEENYRDRYTPSSILVHYFSDEAGKLVRTVETKHLTLTTSASDSAILSGNRTVLKLRVDLKPKMHVYAPGVEGGYIPISWRMAESEGWQTFEAEYPQSRMLHLEAIAETVPVYEGVFEVRRDFQAAQNKALEPVVHDGKLTVNGTFRYQACDDKMCYRPEDVSLEWVFDVQSHDSQRVPEELRRSRN